MSFIYPFCSSSKGNCYYVGDRERGLLVDVGIGIRSFTAQMAQIGVPLSAIAGILITHEHSDHIKGLARIVKQLNVPVYTARGTADALVAKGVLTNEQLQVTAPHQYVGEYAVECIATLHDASESQGYRIGLPDGQTVAICTDLGMVTDTVYQALIGCHAVLIESNYEPNLLLMGGYPYYLKERIRGRYGHLSNQEAGQLLQKLWQSGVRQFVLGHLSQENNRPELAHGCAVDALTEMGAVEDRDYRLYVAPCQGCGHVVMVEESND